MRLFGLRLPLENFCTRPFALLGSGGDDDDAWFCAFDDVRIGTVTADGEFSKVFDDALRLGWAVVVAEGD